MNPVALVHSVVAVITIIVAVPLMRRKVKMNPWYGVRIPAAFASDEAWFDINAYGGRLLLTWGLIIAVVAAAGLLLPKSLWVAYDLASLVIITGTLLVVIVKIFRHARPEK